jgi:hypothetical protein
MLKIENLNPDSLATLRELYRTAFAKRPVLRAALMQILDGIEGCWRDGDAIRAETAELIDDTLLSLLCELGDTPISGPSPEEDLVAHALDEWRRIIPDLRHI